MDVSWIFYEQTFDCPLTTGRSLHFDSWILTHVVLTIAMQVYGNVLERVDKPIVN
jgi:hypothetical protein